MSQTICRWGILGTADIARKKWLAIRNAENCTLTAVARPSPSSGHRSSLWFATSICSNIHSNERTWEN